MEDYYRGIPLAKNNKNGKILAKAFCRFRYFAQEEDLMNNVMPFDEQEIFPIAERQLLASIVAKGCLKAQQIQAMFTYGKYSCFDYSFHTILNTSIENFLIEACEEGLLQSKVSHCRSKMQNHFPYVEYITSDGICWHFKYSPEKGTLPNQSSYRAANASLYNGQLFLEFEELLDGTKYRKPSSQKLFAILTLGHNKFVFTFLKIFFPNYAYTYAKHEINLTPYLMDAYSKQKQVLVEGTPLE